jgi:hypothetical protein
MKTIWNNHLAKYSSNPCFRMYWKAIEQAYIKKSFQNKPQTEIYILGMLHPVSMQWLWYNPIFFVKKVFLGVLLHTVRTINVHYINCKVLKNHFYMYFVLFRSNQCFRIQSTAIKLPTKLLGSYIHVKQFKNKKPIWQKNWIIS